MTRAIKLSLTFLLLTFVIISCTNDVCNEKTVSYLNIFFYNEKTKLDTTISSMSVNVFPYKDSTSILYNHNSLQSINLPLSALDTITKFYVAMDTINNNLIYNIRKDTLTAIYKVSNKFISYECGFRSEFTLKTVKFSSNKDSIAIIQYFVSSNNDKNIKIYFKPLIP